MDYNVADLDNLKYLQQFCRLSNAKLIVANFSERSIDQTDVKKFEIRAAQIKTCLDYDKVSFYQDFSLNAYENIQTILNSSNVDMLAFQKLNKSFLQRLLDAKNTKSLILNTELPTLVF